jgi:hypothetical protein
MIDVGLSPGTLTLPEQGERASAQLQSRVARVLEEIANCKLVIANCKIEKRHVPQICILQFAFCNFLL